jgi:hypothetical protein
MDGRNVESGTWVCKGQPRLRPCETWWIKNIVGQCRDADIAPFVKQVGAVPVVEAARLRHWEWRQVDRPEHKLFTEHAPGKWRVHLNSKKGGDMAEWPEDLRVREFPRTGSMVGAWVSDALRLSGRSAYRNGRS